MHLISSDAQVKIKSAQDFSVRLPNRVLQDPKLILKRKIHSELPVSCSPCRFPTGTPLHHYCLPVLKILR